MKRISWHKGFTLLELIVVIAILAVVAVIAAPRFLSIADDAREVTSRALFDNFRAGAEIYQGACLARGGDVTELQGKNTSDFNIDGIYSNFSGSCYPVRNSNSGVRRDINNARGCYELFQDIVNSDHFEDINFGTGGWKNGETVKESELIAARDAGYQVYIHQRSKYFSYCHYYNIEGDLNNAPYLLYNAVDGIMVSGTTNLSNGFSWANELQEYPVATPPPYDK